VRVMEIWRRVTATRYTRALEAEVARLRAENRAMLNSILGIAGVPPIPVDVASAEMNTDGQTATRADDPSRRDPSSLRSLGMTTKGTSNGDALRASPGMTTKSGTRERRVQAASPMRKRSWQQINRALEFESARKKERPGNVDAGANGLGIARIRA
jgi:hypothetical protein